MTVRLLQEIFPHTLPTDMDSILQSDPQLLALWETITPRAQNEWICWVEYVQKQETRQKHLIQFQENLRQGKKRPCCWPGCPHRT